MINDGCKALILSLLDITMHAHTLWANLSPPAPHLQHGTISVLHLQQSK